MLKLYYLSYIANDKLAKYMTGMKKKGTYLSWHSKTRKLARIN